MERAVLTRPVQVVSELSPPAQAAVKLASPPEPVASQALTVPTRSFVRYWLAQHRAELRTVLLGAISLVLFVLSWHLLTAYRVSFHVRFTNIPTPLEVVGSFARAAHDGTLFHHIVLSCRRIAVGFVIATAIAVPLG